MIIVAHTHALCPEVNGLVAIPDAHNIPPESAEVDRAQFPVLGQHFNDIAARRADMATMGVTHQLPIPAPGQQHYWAEPELLARLSRLQNAHVAKMVAADPDIFSGLGTLPMTAPEPAVAEATHAVETLNLRFFQIDTHADAMELSDPALDPLCARLVKPHVPLVMHPPGFSDGARLGAPYMVNTVGNPLEEVIAANHLILGGVLDRHPGLRVKIVHGGGFFPFLIGRLDLAWKRLLEIHRLAAEALSAHLKCLCYDTVVLQPRLLRELFEPVRPGRIMLGSGYPFTWARRRRATLAASGIPPRGNATIESGAAEAFFRI